GVCRHPGHLQHRRRRAQQRARPPRVGFPRPGRDPVGDDPAGRAARGEPRDVLRDHDRLRPGGGRDDDRARGHRQHPRHGFRPVYRLSDPGGQRGRGDARGARGRHPVPGAVLVCAAPLCRHLPGEHRSRTGAPAPAKEVWAAMNMEPARRLPSRWRREGAPQVWFAAAALAFSLLMVAGLVLLVLVNALGYFWPGDVARLELASGEAVIGEIVAREPIRSPGQEGTARHRLQLKVGNRDVYGLDFRWIPEDDIASVTYPEDITVFERREWGSMYGVVREVNE